MDLSQFTATQLKAILFDMRNNIDFIMAELQKRPPEPIIPNIPSPEPVPQIPEPQIEELQP